MKKEHKKWFFIVYFITNSKAIFYAKKVMSGKYVLSFYWCSLLLLFHLSMEIICFFGRRRMMMKMYGIRKLNIWLRNFHFVLFFDRKEFFDAWRNIFSSYKERRRKFENFLRLSRILNFTTVHNFPFITVKTDRPEMRSSP